MLSDIFAKRDDYGPCSRQGSGDMYGGVGGMIIAPGPMGMYYGQPPNSQMRPQNSY